jgi:hypothetical protein
MLSSTPPQIWKRLQASKLVLFKDTLILRRLLAYDLFKNFRIILIVYDTKTNIKMKADQNLYQIYFFVNYSPTALASCRTHFKKVNFSK